VSERTIGFIGVGRMGLPMASRLIDAGHRLVAFDTQGQALGAIAAKGARPLASPAAVAAEADIVMTSLPRPEIVREVALGEGGIVAGSRVRVFADLSTTGPRMAREIAAALEAGELEPTAGAIEPFAERIP
jgi:2-hydroxy-3-oxopropionate reductase